ncbi:MAG: hypothetical protein P1V18_01920 [Candidatus Gracilibacteria bacterium]|nr:hypothetical protein [Candidatus Gracilibacteria bacterium]
MNVLQVDKLNTALILLSAAAAFILPFELFLFSYAVLGPLHYLTEISWLKKRDFFAPGKYNAWILLGLTLFIFTTRYLATDLRWMNPSMIATAFFGALAMTLVRGKGYKILTALLALAGILLFWESSWYILIFSLLLTTIIHVLLFTATFMLFGAMKSRSRLGYLNIALLFTCAALFFIFEADSLWNVSAYAREVYDGNFYGLNLKLAELFNLGELRYLDDVFNSRTGLSIMRLIAFAYTYHYLNWFSKTSIIGWGEASKKYWTIILPLWVISVGLYVYDYRLGVACLYFLSMLHVLLEFPLNCVSFAGVYSGLKRKLLS